MQQHKTDLSVYKNTWYNTGGSALKRLLWLYVSAIFFQSNFFPFVGVKIWLLRVFGAKIGIGVMIKPSVNIKYPWNVIIKDYAWIGEDVWIDSLVTVSIGESVCLSQGAYILTGNHNYKKSTFDLIVKEVILEDGVWIGAKSVVCPGVICKSHSVLSVNSVATKNLEAYSVYQGNPATKIKDRIVE
ncbi:MAG: colanic acid biosynthesis acetyltransferase WcaF [Pedobacter sp.]|nr:colanic acid biosynthesis acetyltransferase WcaF [Chitinophagaceae bacterium]